MNNHECQRPPIKYKVTFYRCLQVFQLKEGAMQIILLIAYEKHTHAFIGDKGQQVFQN